MEFSIQKHTEDLLGQADLLLRRSYLTELEKYEISPMSLQDRDLDLTLQARFYRLSKLVYSKQESFLQKLSTIVNVASALNATILTVIQGNADGAQFHVGVMAKECRGKRGVAPERRETVFNAFTGAIQGNLAGAELTLLKDEELKTLKQALEAEKGRVFSVSGCPAIRRNDQEDVAGFVQGMENLVDSMRSIDANYTVAFIAEPVNPARLLEIRRGYQQIYTALSPLCEITESANESKSEGFSQGWSENFGKSLTEGFSMTQGWSSGTSSGNALGVAAGITLPFLLTGSYQHTSGKTNMQSGGTARDFHTGAQYDHGVSRENNQSIGHERGLQLNTKNRSIQDLLDQVDKNLARLEQCESLGAFECAAYVLSSREDVARNAAANLSALLRGENSYLQSSHITHWPASSSKGICDYISRGLHPKLKLPQAVFEGRTATGKNEVVTPAVLLNGPELALCMGFPKKSVPGLAVMSMASFGREAPTPSKGLPVGNVYHMGCQENKTVALDTDSLAAHVFITGSTGTGKSNTIYKILETLYQRKIPFLVVEPTKGEYKSLFGGRDDVFIYGTNPDKTPLLRWNPFAFPQSIHVLEHIDRLVEIFNVCWPMYAAMPAVLKRSVEEAYRTCGWDLERSRCVHRPVWYPTFADVLESLRLVMKKSAFSGEVRDNYIGALETRVESLTGGLYRQIFTVEGLRDEALFERNVIVDLSRVASVETKALLMGLLVMRLQEHRMACGGMNLPLRHVTVLEEAHHLLKRTSTEQTMDGANLLGKSVEMLSNSIAEMRTYGEGFLIADQSPSALDPAAIRNSNTKMILRLPDQMDRESAGLSMGLDGDQIRELAKLPTGVACVYQNNWPEAVLCQIPRFRGETRQYQYEPANNQVDRDSKLKRTLTKILLGPAAGKNVEILPESLLEELALAGFPATIKNSVLSALNAKGKDISFETRRVIAMLYHDEDILFEAERAGDFPSEAWETRWFNRYGPEPSKLEPLIRKLVLQCVLKEATDNCDGMDHIYHAWINYAQKGVF